MNHPSNRLLAGGLIALPQLASAHTPIEGIGNFYNGLLHPVLVPAHLLVLIALGLFIGQRGVEDSHSALLAFVIAAAAGLVAAGFSIGGDLERFLLVGAALIGLLTAANLNVGQFGYALLAAAAGLLLGMDTLQESLSGKDKLVSLFGSGVGIYFLFLYPMALADYFKKRPWQLIGVRVVGSWITASSLLVLSLSLAPAI